MIILCPLVCGFSNEERDIRKGAKKEDVKGERILPGEEIRLQCCGRALNPESRAVMGRPTMIGC
jgi:hypothetical protein